MTEPRTETGRRLLEYLDGLVDRADIPEAILAIEAEAAELDKEQNENRIAPTDAKND